MHLDLTVVLTWSKLNLPWFYKKLIKAKQKPGRWRSHLLFSCPSLGANTLWKQFEKLSLLAHRSRGSSPWWASSMAVDLIWGRGSWQNCVAEQHCSLHGSQMQRTRGKRSTFQKQSPSDPLPPPCLPPSTPFRYEPIRSLTHGRDQCPHKLIPSLGISWSVWLTLKVKHHNRGMKSLQKIDISFQLNLLRVEIKCS